MAASAGGFLDQLHRLRVHAHDGTIRIRRVSDTDPRPVPCSPRTRHRPAAGSPSTRCSAASCRFFQRPPDGFVADRLDDPQLDDPARQQAQRPVRVALRGRPQTQGDDLGLLFAVEQLLDRGDSRRFRSSACSKPFSTHRWRMFSTVLVRHEKASATRWSVHAGPSASAFKRICARRTFSLLPLSLRTVCDRPRVPGL